MGATIEEIYRRVVRCSALLQVVYEAYLKAPQEHDALSGVCDLLEDICADFETALDEE